MFVWQILTAIIVGVLITIIFAFIFRVRGPWANAGVFFIFVFLGVWAASLWIAPVGPTILGVYWAPILISGLILGLLLAAATTRVDVSKVKEEAVVKGQYESEEERRSAVSDKKSDVLLWTSFGIISVAFLIAIVIGYIVT
jgi:hypothetical protein